MIVRWGLERARPAARASSASSGRSSSPARAGTASGLPAAARWSEIPSHRIAVPGDVDGILAAGGGSAIDTAKAASAASGLQLVSVPTTYSGAEWTDFFGVRDPDKRMVGGGSGARLAGIVYEPKLTLDLPRPESGRHGDERARPLRRGALSRRSRVGAPRDGTHRRVAAARARRAPATSKRARTCSKAPPPQARRSRRTASTSATRWRRRSAAATGFPTAR